MGYAGAMRLLCRQEPSMYLGEINCFGTQALYRLSSASNTSHVGNVCQLYWERPSNTTSMCSSTTGNATQRTCCASRHVARTTQTRPYPAHCFRWLVLTFQADVRTSFSLNTKEIKLKHTVTKQFVRWPADHTYTLNTVRRIRLTITRNSARTRDGRGSHRQTEALKATLLSKGAV